MGKTRKYIPEMRIAKPYKREPKLRTNIPEYVPFDIYDDDDTEVDDETTADHGNHPTSNRGVQGK